MKNQIAFRKVLVYLTIAFLSLMNWTSIFAIPFAHSSAAILRETNHSYNGARRDSASESSESYSTKQAEANQAYAKLPVTFEANRGQTDSRVKFISRGNNYALFLTSTESVLVLDGPASKKKSSSLKKNDTGAERRRAALRMKFVGANPAAEVEGFGEQPGKTNYLIGNDAGKWRANIPNYARVRYQSIYDGVDLIYYGKQHQIEYDFVVAAGADYRKIKIAIEGAKKARIADNGDLVLTTAVGEVRQLKPVVYQEVDGAKRYVSARYVFKGKNRIGFEVGDYDRSRPLVIDPVIDYSTYLGGTSDDIGRSIFVDASGNAYITGRTFSFNFPVTISAFDTTYANSSDVFVTKLNAAGSALVYSTYIGGTSEDNGFGIFVDSGGSAYITGSTSSNNYPTTVGAFDTVFNNGCCFGDAFVTKLNDTGTALAYSTYLGGSSSDQGNSISVDTNGNAYVTGFTNSSNFPTTMGAFQTMFGGSNNFVGDVFITKLNSAGTALSYSTYLGGTRDDQSTGIVIDSSGNAFVTGSTNSTDFDVTAGAFQTVFGGSSSTFNSTGDAFVTEINDTGTALIYSTYIGGSQDEIANGIALNSSGEAFITGNTESFNFPTTPGIVRVINGGMARSSDSAVNWEAINSGLTDSNILSLAIDPETPLNVYAGTNAGGIFKSVNGGATWMAINNGLTSFTIRSLAIDPTTPTTIYLGTSNRGVFKSTDGGDEWQGINTGQGGSSVDDLLVDPSNTMIVYAGTNAGAFKTTNGGASWTAINTGIGSTQIRALAIDPVTTSNLYASTFGGIFKTTNGGQSWSSTGFNDSSITTLVVDPVTPANVYGGGANGIVKSTDFGMTWQGINSGLINRSVNTIAIDLASPSIVYAGTENGIFKSTNGGGSWSASDNNLAGTVINVLAINPERPETLYAGNQFGFTDGFVTRFTASGAGVVYSTYLGGSNSDFGNAIAIDSGDNAYVTGQTGSENFPTTGDTFQSSSSTDAYVTKLNATGSAFVYSTYLGGFSTDVGHGIAVNSSGNAFVTGQTRSSNFPVTSGAFQTLLGGVQNDFSTDAFVVKLNQSPSLLANLRISLDGPDGTLTANQFVSYDITLTNDGPETAYSIVITNNLPDSLRFNFCNSGSLSCDRIGNTVFFNRSSLDPGQSASATIFVNVDCSIPASTTITNEVTVEALTPDPNVNNNTASVSNTAFNQGETISSFSQSFPISGGEGSVSVSSSDNCPWSAVSNVPWITITFSSGCCNGQVNYNVAANPGLPRLGTMTIAGHTFTVSQEGTGAKTTTVGLFNPATSQFFLKNTNSGGAADITFTYGPAGAGWIPVVGDWNNDGVDTVGLYNPTTSQFFLRNANSAGAADITFTYGPAGAGWIPLAGDWNGDGAVTVGLYNPTTSQFFLKNTNSAGAADITFTYGPAGAGWIPIVGDWNGDGTTTIGLLDPSINAFFLKNTNAAGGADIVFNFGPLGGVGWPPLAGDWNGDLLFTVGLFQPSTSAFFLRNFNQPGPADITARFGPPGAGWTPIVGDWDGM